MLALCIARRLIARAISFGLAGGFTLAIFGMAFGMVIGIGFCALYYAGAFLTGSTAFAGWFLFVILPSGGGGAVGFCSGAVSCAWAACLTARIRESECALGDIVEGALTGASRGLTLSALCGVSTLALISSSYFTTIFCLRLLMARLEELQVAFLSVRSLERRALHNIIAFNSSALQQTSTR